MTIKNADRGASFKSRNLEKDGLQRRVLKGEIAEGKQNSYFVFLV